MTPAFAPASPQQAIDALASRLRPVAAERVPLSHAHGRVLAEVVLSDRPSPAADVSAMDGYALRLADTSLGTIPVRDEVRIGTEPRPLAQGTATRIVTGAAVPPGAEAVIRREDVREQPDHIALDPGAASHLKPGASIRRRGENLPAGEPVLTAGIDLTAPVAAALACFGAHKPLVYRKVRVGILVTGDELVADDETPTDYQLRDSNGPTLRALLSGLPWIEIIAVARCKDDPHALYDAVHTLLGSCDALLLSGGVSMGDRDFVPATLDRVNAQTIFHKVPQRPGRPVLGALSPSGSPILALPGNPVSVMVTARRMAVPILAVRAGLLREPDPPMPVRIVTPDSRILDLWWQRPARVVASGQVELLPTTGSGDIPAAARSDGFVEVPPQASGPGPWPFYSWAL
jgi:molybdopterin molybdotransferase